MADPFKLQRFEEAQNPVFEQVLQELREGRKRTHWMWFIFPQIRGLGSSFMAARFSISSLDEAAAYLNHPILGARLVECTRLALAVEGSDVHEIFGSPDDMKFHSSMTLFAHVDSPESQIFRDALVKYFNGAEDRLTVERI